VSKGSVSSVHSTLFLCCTAVKFKNLLSQFLLPHWSKKHEKKNTFDLYFSWSIVYLIIKNEIILRKGCRGPERLRGEGIHITTVSEQLRNTDLIHLSLLKLVTSFWMSEAKESCFMVYSNEKQSDQWIATLP
jgi:hypothetical protein